MTEQELMEKMLEEQKKQTKLISHLGLAVSKQIGPVRMLLAAVIVLLLIQILVLITY